MSRGEPLIRQWNIIKALQTNFFGTSADEIADRVECSKRQVQRDLKILQEVGFPVYFEDRDFGKRFWRVRWKQIEGEKLTLSMTEMLSLFLSQQLLAPLSGTQFGDGLASAIEKIKAILSDRALGYFTDLSSMLLVKSMAQHDYSGQDKEIRIINQAMAEGKVLKVHYCSASQHRDLETLFHPYGMVFFGSSLYCIGYLQEYDEVRTLKVSRFKGIQLTAGRFERPANFSLANHIGGGFGIMSSGKSQSVKIRFTGWAATNVREHQWHASQKIVKDSSAKSNASGGNDDTRKDRGGNGEDFVIATYELSDTTEFKRWLLGFGQHAVVQMPKNLADELKAEFRDSCKSYGIKCKGQS